MKSEEEVLRALATIETAYEQMDGERARYAAAIAGALEWALDRGAENNEVFEGMINNWEATLQEQGISRIWR